MASAPLLLPAAPVRAAETITDPKGGRYSLVVPDGFTALPITSGRNYPVFASDALPDAAFGADASAVPGSLPADSLDQLIAEALQSLERTMPGYEADGDVQDVMLGSVPAKQVAFFSTRSLLDSDASGSFTAPEGGRFHSLVLFALQDQILYGMFFTAHEGDYDALLMQTSDAVSSFMILNP